MSERQQIVAQNIHDCFVQIPWIVDGADLDVYEFRLLVHYYRVGNCWENTTTTATACHMSRPQVIKMRKSLAEKGWINIKAGGAQDSLTITVVDRWNENHQKYGKKTDTPIYGGKPQNKGGHVVDPKYISLKNNQNLKGLTTAPNGAHKPTKNDIRLLAEQTFTKITRLPKPTSQKELGVRWWTPLREICELAHWDAATVEILIDKSLAFMRKEKLSVYAPASILNAARATVASLDGGIQVTAGGVRERAEQIADAYYRSKNGKSRNNLNSNVIDGESVEIGAGHGKD